MSSYFGGLLISVYAMIDVFRSENQGIMTIEGDKNQKKLKIIFSVNTRARIIYGSNQSYLKQIQYPLSVYTTHGQIFIQKLDFIIIKGKGGISYCSLR